MRSNKRDERYGSPMRVEKYFINSSYADLWTEGIRRSRIYGIIEDFIKVLASSPSDIVLEVGCGEGRFIPLIMKKQGTNYVGTDICVRMLKYAKNRFTHGIRDTVHFVAAEAKHLPFKSKSVNKSFCYATIFFIPKKRLVIKEMERVSKDKILIEFRNLLHPRILFKFIGSHAMNFLLAFPLARKLILSFMPYTPHYKRSWNVKLWVEMAIKDRKLALEPYFPDSALSIYSYFNRTFRSYTISKNKLEKCGLKTWIFKPTVIIEATLESTLWLRS